MASEEIDIGDTVLEIPKSRIISEDVVLQSKMVWSIYNLLLKFLFL